MTDENPATTPETPTTETVEDPEERARLIKRIEVLEAKTARLQAKIAELEAENARLRAENARLRKKRDDAVQFAQVKLLSHWRGRNAVGMRTSCALEARRGWWANK